MNKPSHITAPVEFELVSNLALVFVIYAAATVVQIGSVMLVAGLAHIQSVTMIVSALPLTG